MNPNILWKSMLVQLVAVVLLFVLLRLLLPSSFFEDWGWVSGPLAWMVCALITAAVLKLPRGPVLLGAVVAGLPSVLFVVIGLHAIGPLVAVVLFGVWCAWRVQPVQPSD